MPEGKQSFYKGTKDIPEGKTKFFPKGTKDVGFTTKEPST